jgi:hypothetical protein
VFYKNRHGEQARQLADDALGKLVKKDCFTDVSSELHK